MPSRSFPFSPVVAVAVSVAAATATSVVISVGGGGGVLDDSTGDSSFSGDCMAFALGWEGAFGTCLAVRSRRLCV